MLYKCCCCETGYNLSDLLILPNQSFYYNRFKKDDQWKCIVFHDITMQKSLICVNCAIYSDNLTLTREPTLENYKLACILGTYKVLSKILKKYKMYDRLFIKSLALYISKL